MPSYEVVSGFRMPSYEVVSGFRITSYEVVSGTWITNFIDEPCPLHCRTMDEDADWHLNGSVSIIPRSDPLGKTPTV